MRKFEGAATRLLGATGLPLSQLGVGCGSLATGGGEAAATAMLGACWDHGLRYFDTAPAYGDSEAILGQFLTTVAPDPVVLSTKVGRLPAPQGERRFAFSRDDILRSVDLSLQRLKRDRIDIVAVHDLAPDMLGDGYPDAVRDLLDQGFRALAELKAAGVIGAIGVATYDAAAAIRLLRDAPFDSVMVVGGLTLLSQDAEVDLIPFCAARGMGVVMASPFHTGLLVSGSVPHARYNMHKAKPDQLARTAALEHVCARHGVRLAAAAIQFPLRSTAISSVVTGHRFGSEVITNLDWLRQPIPEAFWDELALRGLTEILPYAAGRVRAH